MTIGLCVNVVGGDWLEDIIKEFPPRLEEGESVASGTKQKPQDRAQNVLVNEGAVMQ